MKRRVRLAVCTAKQPDRLIRPQHRDLDPATPGLFKHSGHHRQRALRAGSDDQAGALPWDLFLNREWRVATFLKVSLRFQSCLPAPGRFAVVRLPLLRSRHR